MNEKNSGFGAFWAGFLMGGLAGAAIAFLTAPRSGEETREQIREKSFELRDTAEQTVDEALTAVKATALDVSNRAEELRAQSQVSLDEAQKQWTQAIGEIKQVASEAIEEMRTTATQAVKQTEKVAADAE
jgi:gas vesicle protein